VKILLQVWNPFKILQEGAQVLPTQVFKDKFLSFYVQPINSVYFTNICTYYYFQWQFFRFRSHCVIKKSLLSSPKIWKYIDQIIEYFFDLATNHRYSKGLKHLQIWMVERDIFKQNWKLKFWLKIQLELLL
jgi:hypothetical protein